MRLLAWIACLLGTLSVAFAAVGPSTAPFPAITVTSKSGQFIVSGPSYGLTLPVDSETAGRTNLVRQSPAELVVTAERIKEALLFTLDARDQWQGKIQVAINPRWAPDSDIRLNCEHYADGWSYTVMLPVQVDRTKLVRAFVHVLLWEIAQRASPTMIELPIWLRDGLARQLQLTQMAGLIVESEALTQQVGSQFWLVRGTVKNELRTDPLADARAQLKGRAVPNFSDLTLPGKEQQTQEYRDTYTTCAQVLVAELLRMPGGQAAMMEMLRQLPGYLNWQFALLAAYRNQFHTMLDVEKWWSLVQMDLQSRDRYDKWPMSVALQKLDEILRPPVVVRDQSGALPQRSSLPLQQLLVEMQFDQQQLVLRQVIDRLRSLQWNVTPDLWKLVQDYQMTLETYLQKRAKTEASSSRSLAKQAAGKLDLLDLLRADFQKYETAPSTVAR